MKISLIAAIARNNVIGVDGKLPWHLPEDFKWFKATTLDKPIIMGRKTFDSIGRKPLPKRFHIIISREKQENSEQVAWATSLQEAIDIARAQNAEEAMIIGGAQIYAESLALAERIYLTEVDMAPTGDAFFPEFDKSKWQRTIIASHAANGDKPAFDIVQYDRK
jgi:dihydrofolate reductase